jgi:hypothetical protein
LQFDLQSFASSFTNFPQNLLNALPEREKKDPEKMCENFTITSDNINSLPTSFLSIYTTKISTLAALWENLTIL